MGSKNKKKSSAPTATPQPQSYLWVVRILLLAATGIASYLAWSSFSGGGLAGCGPTSDCDRVMQSRWAYWFNLPVSVPALAAYLALLTATFQIRPLALPNHQKSGWLVAVMISVSILAAAAWFTGLQLMVVHAVCKYCMTAHACGSIAAIILLAKAPIQKAGAKETRLTISPSLAAKLGLAGLAGCAVLIAGQFAVVRKTYQIVTMTNAPVPAPTTPAVPAAEVPPILSLHEGAVLLKLNELPVIGSPKMPHVLVSLFDYTCHYCREMHGLIMTAQQQFSNQLAIVSLPMPLDSNCNPWVKQTPSAHQHACDYARLGLMVWRAKPEVFRTFDEWIFGSPSPPPLDQARQYVSTLIGAENFNREQTDPWIDDQIRLSVKIYELNSRQLHNGMMPQLVIGSAISVGPLHQVDELYRLLEQHMGLKRPEAQAPNAK